MNKIFKFMLVFAASAFLFAACDKPEPEPTPTPDPNEGTTEEVCDKCGKNPCECEEEQTPTGPEWCTSLFTVEFTGDETAGYDLGSFKYDELTNAEGQTIHEYLGYESWEELAAAIGTIDEAKAFDRETQLFGIDLGSESDILEPYNTNGFGYWVDANGVKDAWGTETVRCFTEAFPNEETGFLDPNCGVGVMPGNVKEGDNYKFGMVFQRTGDEVLRAGVQVSIKIEAFKDPEAGQYSGTPVAGTFDFDYEATMTLSTHEYDYDGPAFEDLTAVQEKLGMTKFEISKAFAEGFVADDEGNLYTGMIVEVVLPDGTTFEGTNVWLNADNAQTTWGAEDAAVCYDLNIGATYFDAGACAMPSYYEVAEGEEAPDPSWYYGDAVKAAVGKTIEATYRITYVPADDLGVAAADPTVININFAVTVAE